MITTRSILSLAFTGIMLTSCIDSDATDEEQDQPQANGRRDLMTSDVDITGQRGGLLYSTYDVLRDHRGSGKAFADYGCATDCTDIRAGYQAAAASGATNMRQCTGATWGELEGCVAFTEGRRPVISQLPPLEE